MAQSELDIALSIPVEPLLLWELAMKTLLIVLAKLAFIWAFSLGTILLIHVLVR